MTRTTNARIAGFTFLFYIAVALTGVVLSSRAARGEGTAAKLASIAGHASNVRAAVLLELLGCFSALVLAATLYSITRDQDPDLAMLVLVFRAGEGVIGAVSLPRTLERLWLATATGLAWVGVIASILIVVGLPLQLVGILRGPITQLMWLPMLAFEVPLGLWLLIKGVRPTRPVF